MSTHAKGRIYTEIVNLQAFWQRKNRFCTLLHFRRLFAASIYVITFLYVFPDKIKVFFYHEIKPDYLIIVEFFIAENKLGMACVISPGKF